MTLDQQDSNETPDGEDDDKAINYYAAVIKTAGEVRQVLDQYDGASMNPEILIHVLSFVIFTSITSARTLGMETKNDKQQPAEKWILEGIRRNLVQLNNDKEVKAMIERVTIMEKEMREQGKTKSSIIMLPEKKFSKPN